MYEMEREEFEAVVADAANNLPEAFRDQIANLEFSVEEWANRGDYARTSTPATAMLLGVYRGIPLTKRGGYYNMSLPDTIVVFRQPLQRIARDEADLRDRIRHVVVHEVAHYFGISDDRLREIDAY
ncbi:MAG TPA: metallopeptidase family protein [Dehalococcoidia bacterium]|jgi:predicted Zn-dependent protease with MMP-like domain|nr:metallopeptidase family protein [Dehalococcoidia bacterium]